MCLMSWVVSGCVLQDVLAVLQARSAAAALMRAACTTTASLLVHLNDADTKPLEACSLLDAIVCEYLHNSSYQQPGQLDMIARMTDTGFAMCMMSISHIWLSSKQVVLEFCTDVRLSVVLLHVWYGHSSLQVPTVLL